MARSLAETAPAVGRMAGFGDGLQVPAAATGVGDLPDLPALR